MLKKIHSILVSTALAILLIGCSSTEQLAISIVEPAPVQLSSAVKRIGVVKNIPASINESKLSDGLASLVSRDDEYLTQKGVDAALEGLLIKLLQDPRFDTIINLSEEGQLIQMEGGQPTLESWQNIEAFCRHHRLDAIFSLDYYQADTRYTLKKTKVYERDIIRADVAKKAHQLTLETLIENGWKIYDPFQKNVLDEFFFEDQITSSATGSSPMRAYRSIGALQDSLVIKSKGSGSAYGSRLEPFESTIYRAYYTKGSSGIISAHHKVIEEDWEGAIDLLKNELTTQKSKLQAMSCHNLAVIYEFLEDLNEARHWAEKAYEYNPGKKSMFYLNELDERIAQNRQVAEQLAFLGR